MSKKADDAYHLGRAPLANYLNPVKIADVAVALGCDAIHPGYGFLSEKPGLSAPLFLAPYPLYRPPATIIRHMGDKVKARKKMREAGVPVIPGSKRRLPFHCPGPAFGQHHRLSGDAKSHQRRRRARYSPLRKRRRS